MCTIAAPALAASIAEAAICSGVTGTAGFLAGDSAADPVTAQEIMTLRCTASPPRNSLTAERLHRPAGGRILLPNSGCRTLPLIVRCAKPKPLLERIQRESGRFSRVLARFIGDETRVPDE